MDKYKTLKTGDLVKARVNKIPFIFHYGFVLVENGRPMIYHNTPNQKNEQGGNIIVTDPDTWTRSRTIVSIKATDVTAERIHQVTEKHIKKPFKLLTWNCEHYVFLIKDKTIKSPQLSAFIWYASILLFFLLTKRRQLFKSPASIAIGALSIATVLMNSPKSISQ